MALVRILIFWFIVTCLYEKTFVHLSSFTVKFDARFSVLENVKCYRLQQKTGKYAIAEKTK